MRFQILQPKLELNGHKVREDNMTTPTQKQQKAMARWLGFTWDTVMKSWQYPDGVFCDSLPDFTDLTTLFLFLTHNYDRVFQNSH